MIPAFLFAAISVAVELAYYSYAIGRGLPDKTVSIPVGSWNLPLSIALILSLGNSVVLVTLWMSVFENTAFVRAGPDRQVRRLIYPLRMLRAAAIVLTPFTVILFGPSILESGWFLGFAGSLADVVPQLRGTTISFYTWAFSVSRTDASLRFIASQLSAALAAVLVSVLQLWRVKGTRNLRLALRRKK